MQKNHLALFLSSTPSYGGLYQYSQSLLQAFLALPEERYRKTVIYLDPVWQSQLPAGMEAFQVRSNLISKVIWSVYKRFPVFKLQIYRKLNQWIDPIAREFNKHGIQYCLFPAQDTWSLRLPVKSIFFVHDLMHRYEKGFPESSNHQEYRFREFLFSAVAKNAFVIIAESNFGMHQFKESYVLAEKVKTYALPYPVTPYLREYEFRNSSEAFESKNKIAELFRSNQKKFDRYFFYPAQFWEHKNHLRLIEAFKRFLNQCDDTGLVLCGGKKNAYESVFEVIRNSGLESKILLLDYISEEQIIEFYQNSLGLVYPTFYGPTNIPPIEAIWLGCVPAVSRIYGMPDQLQDAALYFDPRSVTEIEKVLLDLRYDSVLRTRVKQNGIRIRERFSPQSYNDRLIQIIADCTGGIHS